MLAPVLALALAIAPAPEQVGSGSASPETETETETETEPEPERDPSIRGGWLAVAPLGFAWASPGRDVDALRRAVAFGYRWGFSAGASFEPVPHLFVNVAAGFDQTLWIFRNGESDGYLLCFRGGCYGWDERAVGQILRVGPELRLGWVGQRAMAWALGTVQLGVGRVRLDCNNAVEDHCDRTETDLGASVGGGLGVAWRMTPWAALGLETTLDHAWLDRRDDPFRQVRTVDLALLLALRF